MKNPPADQIWRARDRNPRLHAGLSWLEREYSSPMLLDKDDVVRTAKKIICRAMNCELTRAQTEAYLRGET